MKRTIIFLAMLLALTGCAKQQAPAAEAQAPEVQQTVPEAESAPVQEDAPQPETQPETPEQPNPEPEPEPEPPAEAAPQPDGLPYPAYCFGDTAVAADGSVLFEVPDHTLVPVFDEVTGAPAGFLAMPRQISMTLYSAFYGPDGQLHLNAPAFTGFHTAGDLFWYFAEEGFTLQRISDGAVLGEDLNEVGIAGDLIVVQNIYHNEPTVCLDCHTGEPVLELEQGFVLSEVFADGEDTYFSIQNTMSGRISLIDRQGEVLLEDFGGSIYEISQGIAVTSDQVQGQTLFSARDLKSGETLLQRGGYFRLLPEAVLADHNRSWQLQDLQGQPLHEAALEIADAYDLDGDGVLDTVLGSVFAEQVYSTLVLRPDGTELGAIPAEYSGVIPISPSRFVCSGYVGTDFLQLQIRLADLDSGTETVLVTGNHLDVQAIETSAGSMIFCSGPDGAQVFGSDGTPILADLSSGSAYLGGDVFRCEEGLRCLDGSWLYQPE